MTEAERKAIEEELINPNLWKTLEEKISLPDDYKQARHTIDSELNKIKLVRYFGDGNHKKTIIPFSFNIQNQFRASISSKAEKLNEAREEANDAFEEYMDFKKNILNGKLSYTNIGVRNELNSLKEEWNMASNNVIECKTKLKQIEFRYNCFMNWYKATNDYIKKLETENTELKNS